MRSKMSTKSKIKKQGGFGTDYINFALSAPPKHMPLLKPNAFQKTGPSSDILINKSNDNDNDSVAISAAAASDAAPGERELGNLLDKKIKLMERNATNKNSRKWAKSGGFERVKGAKQFNTSGRIGRPKSANATATAGIHFNSSGGNSGIRKPPKSTLRPKSAVLRRLPYGR